MKKIIILILVIVLLVPGWLGYKELRRYSLLNSGEDLLLIKKDANLYVYSDQIDFDNIDRSWKVIGKLSKLSSDEQQSIIGDREEFVELTAERLADLIQPILPENDIEQSEWGIFLANNVTPEQKAFCESIIFQDTAIYCLIRHGVLNAIRNNQDISACDGIYIPDNKDECIKDIETTNLENVPDKNNDQLIDSFEIYIENSGIITPSN